MSAAVGVDVGGTFAKIALVDTKSCRVLEALSIPTEPERPPKEFVRHVAEAVKGWRYSSVGLGLAGGVDAATGTLLFAPNLRGWVGFPFRREFERALGVPAAADNDANAAVWGGYVAALGGKPRNVIGLTLGTGVGGGAVVDGELRGGSGGVAGEFGHQIVRAGGAPCGCGKKGCLEAYCGTAGILRAARRLMKRPPSPLTPKALAGDPAAAPVWEEVGTWLGIGVANLALAYNPDAVLILGGVARAGRLLLDPLRRVLDAEPFRATFDKLVVSAPAGRDWGCVGAALLTRETGKRR